MFLNWVSTYDYDNAKVIENKTDYKRQEINDWFKNKYHNYHRALYNTDMSKTIGIHGDKPIDKFNKQQVDGKLYRDNLDVEIGTTKAYGDTLPGYSGKNIIILGYLPMNGTEKKNVSDPYFNLNKTNHMLNFKTRLVGYKGHIPSNTCNIKGTLRPYCLSTKGESFK